jgi:hypothetical protein
MAALGSVYVGHNIDAYFFRYRQELINFFFVFFFHVSLPFQPKNWVQLTKIFDLNSSRVAGKYNLKYGTK